ncbi:unnamed protein product, partial [Parascedosporium putredinis]
MIDKYSGAAVISGGC